MRLFNTKTYELEYFATWAQVPPYAILSHTWSDDEVVYDDITFAPNELEILMLRAKIDELMSTRPYSASTMPLSKSDPATEFSAKYPHLQWAVKKEGWKKIEGCCQEAEKYGVHHLWIDTICINKRVCFLYFVLGWKGADTRITEQLRTH